MVHFLSFIIRHLTVYFCVGLPFVVPASERLAVELGTLLGPEVHTGGRTGPSVAQLIKATGSSTEFSIVLWSRRQDSREDLRTEIKMYDIVFTANISHQCQETMYQTSLVITEQSTSVAHMVTCSWWVSGTLWY